MRKMSPGEPVFVRLKQPDYAIVGYAFLRTSRFSTMFT